MDDEALWKRRFHLFAAVRLAGLAMVFLGLAIAFTDLLRDGGWPLLGVAIAIFGLLDALLAPRMLKRQWDRE